MSWSKRSGDKRMANLSRSHRRKRLRLVVLCREYNVPREVTDRWVDELAEVQQVHRDLIREGETPPPPPNPRSFFQRKMAETPRRLATPTRLGRSGAARPGQGDRPDGPRGEPTLDDDPLPTPRRVIPMATATDAHIRLHVDLRPLADELRGVAAHLDPLTDDDRTLLKGLRLRLLANNPPVAAALDRALAMALGTDSVGGALTDVLPTFPA